MSIRRLHQVVCDQCNEYGPSLHIDTRWAYKAARILGWKHITRKRGSDLPARDLCPTCVRRSHDHASVSG